MVTIQIARWALGIGLALCLAGCGPAVSRPLTEAPQETADRIGVASVIDGDTIEIHGTRVRLYGIDAFERGQRCRDKNGYARRCGRDAAMALDQMIGGQTVFCTQTGWDRYDRVIARCGTQAIADLGAAMVMQGWALAFVRYSQRYVAQQEDARAAGRGVWQGAFDDPSDWRAGRRTEASS